MATRSIWRRIYWARVALVLTVLVVMIQAHELWRMEQRCSIAERAFVSVVEARCLQRQGDLETEQTQAEPPELESDPAGGVELPPVPTAALNLTSDTIPVARLRASGEPPSIWLGEDGQVVYADFELGHVWLGLMPDRVGVLTKGDLVLAYRWARGNVQRFKGGLRVLRVDPQHPQLVKCKVLSNSALLWQGLEIVPPAEDPIVKGDLFVKARRR